jgi:ubiquinol oxidase
MFDEFQTTPGHEFRRPKVDNLYDVFMNIRDDESEHVKTMIALQQPEARLTFYSPHTVVELMPVNGDKILDLAPTMSYLKDNIET